MRPVTMRRGDAPVYTVRYDPIMVEGTPVATLHQTICQSRRSDFQYSTEAINKPGTVAGSGAVTAANPVCR